MADEMYSRELSLSEQRAEMRKRLDALSKVIGLFEDPELMPNPIDLLAMAEWVIDGSISAAAASQGQSLAVLQEIQREGE